MKQALSILLLLQLAALHSSIAGMELFSWLLFVGVVAYRLKRGERLDFPLWRPGALLLLAVLISLLVNPWLKPFWFQFGFMRWIFLLYGYYWALEIVWSEVFSLRLLTLWNVMLVVAGLYAVAQCFWGVDPIRPGTQVVIFEQWGQYKGTGYFAMKATGLFSLSLTYAYSTGQSLLAVGLPSFQTRLKPWAWGARLVAMLGVFSSMSRGAWLGVVLCALIPPFAGLSMRWRVVFVGGVIAAAVAVLAYFGLDHSSVMRFDIWRAYGQMFLEHPFFGIGLLQGDLLMPDYYTQLGIVQPFVGHAHNVILQWAAGAGIFALAAYLYLAGALLLRAWRLRLYSPWGWSLFLAQVFMHFGGLTECNFFDGEVLHMTVFLWAVTLVQEKIHRGARRLVDVP